jgi:hypothetical protein
LIPVSTFVHHLFSHYFPSIPFIHFYHAIRQWFTVSRSSTGGTTLSQRLP